MNIRIESLSATGLGPIPDLQVQLRDINLIYGKNEKGKTYLTEFILRSLFRNTPKTRQLTDSGQILVSGLNKGLVQFSPGERKKLEDFIFYNEIDQPVDLFRLCVVKGGELSFQPFKENAIDKSILKGYLSDQRVFEKILYGIDNSTQDCSWENGQIRFGKRTGDVKRYFIELENLERLNRLLSDLDASYTLGALMDLQHQQKDIENQINDQQIAKRSLAFTLSEQQKEKERELKGVNENDLDEINTLLIKLEFAHRKIESLTEDINKLTKETETLGWIQSAINEIEKRPEAQAGRAWIYLFILGLVFLLVTLVLFYINQTYVALGTGILSLFITILGVIQTRSRFKHFPESEVVEKIKSDVEKQFDFQGNSLAALKAKEKELNPKYYELNTLKDQRAKEKTEVGLHETRIMFLFAGLLGRKIDKKEDFYKLQKSLQTKHDDLDNCIQGIKMKLAGLQVPEEEYNPNPVKRIYSSELLKELENKKSELSQSYTVADSELTNLKRRICDQTGDEFTAEWEDIIKNLREKRNNVRITLIGYKAIIGAGIKVTEAINQMKLGEDKKIAEALSAEGISKPLFAITGVYDRIELDGETIFVRSKTRRFRFSDLSTGAQEQVLLALRIGIATHILKDQKMFLILDDAFQHSDWDRRKWLVDEMGVLANLGWQIIYFSMDDNIKDLFEKRIKSKFEDRYQAFELNH